MNCITQVKNYLHWNLDLIFRLFTEPWKNLEFMFKIFELALSLNAKIDVITSYGDWS